jgi:hypothetical protein
MSSALAAALLALSFGASVACDAPPGTVIGRVLASGGDGKAITFTAVGGDTADFRVRPSGVVVVGNKGIDPARCGSNQFLAVTANQN